MRADFPNRFLQLAVVLALLASFAVQVIRFARDSSATFDEVAHLPAGYTYLLRHDYRLNCEHPPLVKKLAALPLLLSPVSLEPPGSANPALIDTVWNRGLAEPDAQWIFGQQFLYGIRPEVLERLHAGTPWDTPLDVRLDKADFANDADQLLFRARMMVMLFGLALGALVFLWARALFGFAGGLLALTLFCFDPNFVAHSGLVTTDVPAAFCFLGAMYFLWRCTDRPGLGNLCLFLGCFGLAFVTKFSAVLLVPMFWLAVAGRVASTQPWPACGRSLESRRSRAALVLGIFLMASLAVYLAIWAAYSFRYSAAADPTPAARAEAQLPAVRGDSTPGEQTNSLATADRYRLPGHLPIESALRQAASARALAKSPPAAGITLAAVRAGMDKVRLGLPARMILFAQEHQLLPEAYLYGFAFLDLRAMGRVAFLRGHVSADGFRDYFLWAFLLKTPLPAMLLGLSGLALALRGGGWSARTGFLLAPAGFYLLVTVIAKLDIGHRHLLPVYPFLYVLAGGLVVAWRRLVGWKRPLVAVGALSLIVISSQVVFSPQPGSGWQIIAPHELSYFNELAGGPFNGGAALVDSNLDWGQGLKDLKRWLDQRGVKDPVYLCYFGQADPRYYQISHRNFLGGYQYEPQAGFSPPAPGSLVAISASEMSGLYFSRDQWLQWSQILKASRFLAAPGYSIFVFEYLGEPPVAPVY